MNKKSAPWILLLLLLLLCACKEKPNLDATSEIETPIIEAPILSNPKVSIDQYNIAQDMPNLHSKHTLAVEAYNTLLAGEPCYISGSRVRAVPLPAGEYTLIDMNDDGIPELAINHIMLLYLDEDDNVAMNAYGYGIYSYRNGEITKWYQSGKHAFELLSNKAILLEYEGLGGYNYYYIELDYNGGYGYFMHAFKYGYKENEEVDWKYYISFDSTSIDLRQELATEEEWLDFLEPYLSLRTDIIPWKEYTLDILPKEP